MQINVTKIQSFEMGEEKNGRISSGGSSACERDCIVCRLVMKIQSIENGENKQK